MLQKGSDVPPELMAICAKAASKAPEDRYPTANAMRDAVRAYITEHSLEFPSEKLRDLLHRTFESERTEMRRLIDQRMKHAQLEDEHPSEVSKAPFVPNAAAVFGDTAGGTSPSSAARLGRGKLFAAAAAVALLAGAAGAFIMRLRPPAPVAGSAAAAAPSTLGSPHSDAATAQPLVKLELSAEPASAELILDGAKLEGNPFSGQLPKDAALHRLEVRAPGRKTEARLVRFDRDLTLHVELPVLLNTPAAPASGTPAKAVARPGSTPSAHADDFVHKQRDSKPARPIDNSDPYGP
jgi:hypothetical protein